jgi:hypothetical protein
MASKAGSPKPFAMHGCPISFTQTWYYCHKGATTTLGRPARKGHAGDGARSSRGLEHWVSLKAIVLIGHVAGLSLVQL